MMNLHQKINSIQKVVTSVFKGARVSITQSSSYTAVSHDDVAALLHLPMANAGIAVEVDMLECVVTPIITEKEYQGKVDKKYSYQAMVKMAVTFVNSDDPKDRFTVNSYAYAFDSGDKAVGKAESMAVKYVYLKNFNLESTDDEESRPTEHHQEYNYEPKKEFSTKDYKTSTAEATPAQLNAIKAICAKKGLTNPNIKLFEDAKNFITEQNKR